VTAADARWDLAGARGAARATLAAAQSAAGHARHDRDECRRMYEGRLARLAERREADLRKATEGFRDRAHGLGRALDALAARSASGAAGTSWRTWRPTEPGPGRGGMAGSAALLRIGAISVERPLPALVPLLDRAHLWLSGPDTPAADAVIDGVICGLLLRALGSTVPGDVSLTVYDPRPGGGLSGGLSGGLGGGLGEFAPLGAAGLVTFVGADGLGATLDGLVDHIDRVTALLADEHASLADLAEAGGGRRRPEPWRVAVLLGDEATATRLTAAERAQLDRIVRTGAACGVHLIVRGLPACGHPTVHRVDVRGAVATCTTTGEIPVRLDEPPPAERVAAVCRDIADRVLAGPPPAEFEDLQPAHPWTESSAAGLAAPLGTGPDGELVEVALGDDRPHALICGPSGSGKTNLVHAWLAALCSRYAPDELALYLLDCSGGVSFARFAPGPRDPSWLPQARVVGVNVDADRALGVALLRRLGDERRRRAMAAARYGAATLAELRAEDPGGDWPRLVAVIDDFPALLTGGDALAAEAGALLDELARRGRSQGIHLVLVAQDGTGVGAVSGQFPLRIALPKARGVLAGSNLAADVIPRFHAVVNAEGGAPSANRVVRLPDAGDREAWRRLQERLWNARPDALPPPEVMIPDEVTR
jgi:hypothetical protein